MLVLLVCILIVTFNAPFVYRLGHRPFTAVRGVRFSYGVPLLRLVSSVGQNAALSRPRSGIRVPYESPLNTIMIDIIFCSLPYSDLDHVYSAPAILKGVVTNEGYTAKTVDFGCALLNQCNKNVNYFSQIQSYFISPVEITEEIELFYDKCIEFFIKNPSKFIGISILSMYTHRATYELCKRIKESNIKSKIVIGGMGCKTTVFSSVESVIISSPKDRMIPFGDLLKSKNLVDECILGDGEDAILQILRNEYTQSTSTLVSDSFKYPIPNYDDYNFSDYLFPDEVMLPVTGSKGCVRDCDFCDIKYLFGKYRYRSGSDIANEIISVSQSLGIKKFQFTDSLVNGGLKPFVKFLEILADYNLKNPDKKIKWNGQYICRPSSQMPNGIYKLMSDAGAEGLTIGAESGSNNVLDLMNKKTTVEALFEELEQFRINNITCVILTFVGHWNETWDDFIDHCKMIINLTPYVRSGTISSVSVGPTAMLLHGTPAYNKKDQIGLMLSEVDNMSVWYNKNNKDNTFKERIRRRLIIYEICKKLRIPTSLDYDYFTFLKNIIDTKYDKINDFYETQFRESN